MSGRRFYVPPGTLEVPGPRLGTHLAHRIGRVLRLGVGDGIHLFDGSGREALATILDISRDAVLARVDSLVSPATEPAVRVTLCQALLPSDRFEWVLEKGTELGVAAFVPLLAGRSTARASAREETAARRLERWRGVVQAAAEQSGRVCLPEVRAATDWGDFLQQMPQPTVVGWEESRSPLDEALAALKASRPSSVWLAVGPEGGLTAEEVEHAAAAGATIVSLGPRTLRSETAGIALATLVLHSLGALSP